VVHSNYNPERLVLGEWDELVWAYDKVNSNDSNVAKYKTITDEVKNNIGENLIIHESEHWHFLPNGVLLLKGKNSVKKAHWIIKGRGHILQIKHEDKGIENYNIVHISDHQLVLNFEWDIEIRGIAQLSFNRK
jgi:hypothetical protein